MTRMTHPLMLRPGRSAASSARRPGPGGRRGRPVPATDLAGSEVSVEIRREGPGPVVAVAGELDLLGGQLLDAVLAHVRTTDPGPVAVDLAHVTFVDSHGLAPALDRDVDLVAASPEVSRMLRLLGLPARDRNRSGPPPAATG